MGKRGEREEGMTHCNQQIQGLESEGLMVVILTVVKDGEGQYMAVHHLIEILERRVG